MMVSCLPRHVFHVQRQNGMTAHGCVLWVEVPEDVGKVNPLEVAARQDSAGITIKELLGLSLAGSKLACRAQDFWNA